VVSRDGGRFGVIIAGFKLWMRPPAKDIKRRTRQRLYAAAAVLSLAVWLCMSAAEVCRPLHAWLHGGTIPDDDDCAIVAITHGKVEPVACDLPVLVPVTWVEVTPRMEFSVFRKTVENLLSGRSPPALPAVS
jgi:hypothetical protein